MNNMVKEAHHKYEQLLQPTVAIIKVLRSIYKGEIVSSPFTNVQNSFANSNNAASSIFRSAAQNTSAFGQNSSSVFGGSAPTNVFGQSQNNSAAKSIFAQATQSAFGQAPTPAGNNFFGASPNSSPDNSAAKSIFAQASQNIFGANQQSTQSNAASVFASANQGIFGSDPFGQKQNNSPFANPQNVAQSDPFKQSPFSNSQTSSVFQTQKPSGFGTNVFQQQTTDEVGIYSDIDSLSPEDLEDFRSDEFKLGFIPEVPPPKTLCF